MCSGCFASNSVAGVIVGSPGVKRVAKTAVRGVNVCSSGDLILRQQGQHEPCAHHGMGWGEL